MATGAFVLYFRVSTARQGASGLGIEAQRAAVATFLNGVTATGERIGKPRAPRDGDRPVVLHLNSVADKNKVLAGSKD